MNLYDETEGGEELLTVPLFFCHSLNTQTETNGDYISVEKEQN